MLSQLRSLWEVLKHTFVKADTVEYPEQKPALPPRYRGRIVLTRDPDGEERCVACNLCAVACPVELYRLAENRGRERALVSGIFSHQFFPLHHVRILRRSLSDKRHSINARF